MSGIEMIPHDELISLEKLLNSGSEKGLITMDVSIKSELDLKPIEFNKGKIRIYIEGNIFDI